jgi:hypothetical protein
MSKIGMVRTSSAGGLGPQMSSFNSMRNLSRKGTVGGNPLTRDGSGHSSGTPGAATPASMTSTNSFEYFLCTNLADDSIFRNESENKDDESMAAPAQKIAAVRPDAEEVAEGGYYTVPPMKKVGSTASVPNFVVVRKGYGSVSFKSAADLTGITSLSVLREYVQIERGRVTIYPNVKPSIGEGMNVPAEILLEKCSPNPGVSIEDHINSLKARPETKFVSYDIDTGAWVFNVQHSATFAVDTSVSA